MTRIAKSISRHISLREMNQKDTAMIKFVIRRERCKACGLCIASCPKKILKDGSDLNVLGHHAVIQVEPEKCSGCGLCATMCPDVCFDIYKVEDAVEEVAS